MKRTFTLLTLTAALFATAPAHANELDDRAEWIAALMLYDHECESLGFGFKDAAINALSPIPREVFAAALDKRGLFYKQVGAERWCELTTERIKDNHQWKFQTR